MEESGTGPETAAMKAEKVIFLTVNSLKGGVDRFSYFVTRSGGICKESIILLKAVTRFSHEILDKSLWNW